MMRQLTAGVLAAGVCGCGRPEAAPAPWSVLFGPVISNEVVVGRVTRGATTWLATTAGAVVRVDLHSGSHSRVAVGPLARGEEIWGLATVPDGSMWTLVGWASLAELDSDGQIRRRIDLRAQHVGLYSTGADLLYQATDFSPPSAALAAGPPGADNRRGWSSLRTRALPLGRGITAAANMVACGATDGNLLPCWFPDQATLTLTDVAGASRELPLDGIQPVRPESLVGVPNPIRPIRDAFTSAAGDAWVIAGNTGPSQDRRPGGSVLLRYSETGHPIERIPLPEPARLILAVRPSGCVLLAWDGRIVEVRP